MKVVAKARVQLTVETVVGSWGADCHLTQVFHQSKQDAIAAIEKELPRGWRVVGEPQVTAILTDEDKS
jgi:hypothetical protein